MYLVMEYLKEPWGEVLVREFSLQSLPVVAVNCHVYFSSPREKKTMPVFSDDGAFLYKTTFSMTVV